MLPTAPLSHSRGPQMASFSPLQHVRDTCERRPAVFLPITSFPDQIMLCFTCRYTFLARVATIVDAHGPRVAYMSSLREVSVLDTTGEAETLCIPVSVEPAVLAIGAGE
jgi:hypothetical protein